MSAVYVGHITTGVTREEHMNYQVIALYRYMMRHRPFDSEDANDNIVDMLLDRLEPAMYYHCHLNLLIPADRTTHPNIKYISCVNLPKYSKEWI